MKVVLHDRTNGLAQEVRDTARRKLTRLERHFDRVGEAELEFSEKLRSSELTWFVCRVRLRLEGHRAPMLHAMERGDDPLTALDLALDKIDRQLVAFKEKVTSRKQTASPVRVPSAGRRAARPAGAEPDRIRVKLRPMSEADALSELQADGQPALVYLDENSGEIQVLLRRPDGSLAVIEPVIP